MIAKRNEQFDTDQANDPTVGLASVNDVHLIGRISVPAKSRVLPSGDEIATFRLVVDRVVTASRSKARVDAVECIAWSARMRAQVGRWGAGDVVELRGALRRRFFRSASGRTESRTEVEVFSGRLKRRAGI